MYEETRDPMYLALAVGALPHQPPLWAIEECARLTEPIGGFAHGGTEQERMGERLDEMWRFFFRHPDNYATNDDGRIVSNKGPSLAAAARHALLVVDNLDGTGQSNQFEAAMINVQRMWRAEATDVVPSLEEFEKFELFDGLIPTPRMVRILKEWGDDETGRDHRRLSLHLARHDRVKP